MKLLTNWRSNDSLPYYVVLVRVKRETYKELLTKTKSRLNIWKSKAMFMTEEGHSCKVHHPFSSRICHIYDEMDKLCIDFSWGDHTRGKKTGGLAIKKIRKINYAFLLKLGWEICVHPDKLWIKFVRNKYKCSHDTIFTFNPFSSSSICWRGIHQCQPLN
ncbi:hypothetical protein CR513_37510, partial [Mucuna pruriens]